MITPGRKVATAAAVTEPGDWFIDQDVAEAHEGVATFYYRAPDGVKNSGADWVSYDHLYVRTGEKRQGYWQWDGNLDAPTLAPSIRHLGKSDWHGFFEAGQWRTL